VKRARLAPFVISLLVSFVGGYLGAVVVRFLAAPQREPSVGIEDAVYVAPEATIMTRERSGSFTAGSSGRTKPFSTMPATANG
jgi:hypothetical protein